MAAVEINDRYNTFEVGGGGDEGPKIMEVGWYS
jgi:hypothetical protein